ncbi:hypothetical protein [Desulfitobacterium sp.]|uniref:hypothetical protein n=1 Tax=Desulfitobacterium sp. TaxID=49981 RepID=UPI002D06A442|nr:hypothetical protein [Desulfitobacterium sp.]HVJ49083.1 hypothetical protein [Desulfitobacterium sp.]
MRKKFVVGLGFSTIAIIFFAFALMFTKSSNSIQKTPAAAQTKPYRSPIRIIKMKTVSNTSK